MPNKKKGLDITHRVFGKLEDGAMNLYLNNTVIGQLVETEDGTEYRLHEGYLFSNNRIYRHEDNAIPKVEQYVEGCDMGWC